MCLRVLHMPFNITSNVAERVARYETDTKTIISIVVFSISIIIEHNFTLYILMPFFMP